ncbi:MAG: hypothetical protein AAFR38_12160 [Planctomycetota bacterium]
MTRPLVLAATLALGGCAAPQRPATVSPGVASARASNPIVDVDAWTFAGSRGRLIRTANFRIHTTMPDSTLLGRFPRFAELALTHYSTTLGPLPRPRAPLETYLMASRPQWATLTQTLLPERANVLLRIQSGGYAAQTRAVYFDIGPQRTLNIAAHEGWHQYTQSVFRQPLPIWLEEGLACYMEGFRWSAADPNTPDFKPWSNPERFDRLRELVANGRVLPLRELLDSRPEDLLRTSAGDTLDYYAQVWALAHFLAEGLGAEGRIRLERIVREAAGGTYQARLREALGARAARNAVLSRIGNAPFRIYFNEDLAGADAHWRRFLTEITRTGARDAIILGRSPIARPPSLN